ncbi:MAG: ParB/RepB/Spo0J family partition protein [Acidimicrobiia bacterium]
MTTRRAGLGRGLEALIPVREDRGTGFAMIPIDEITPNPSQPRSNFDKESLAGLAQSISQVGILQPIIVRPGDPGYVLVAGERRWRAARTAGLGEIPAIIRADDEGTALTEALIENVQREDLNPLEEAGGYRQLLEDFGMTHEQVADRVGKSRSAVSNTLRLLGLPPEIQGMLARGELTAGHARALLGAEDAAYAEHIARRAAAEGWSVRQVETAVRARSETREVKQKDLDTARPAAIIELEERLAERLGAPVKIEYRGRKGRVVIRYGSLDDLERIYRTLFSSP